MISGFDARLIELIESHPSIIIGTCDPALVPTMSRGFGGRVVDGGAAIRLVVSRWPGPKTLANIAETGRIAVTFTAPETFVSYQIKGRVTDWGDCTPADEALAALCAATIRQRVEALGEPPHAVRPTFLQTPGKNAGQQL
jgi:hypothetical protein